MFDYGKKTYIMGILNVTPDSFSDGGKYNSVETALDHAKKMINEGVDIIDLGGESTRPGHDKVDADEELKRIIPVVKAIKENLKAKISIDTYKARVADESLKLGADLINDIWGLRKDPYMANTIAKHNAYVCIMHNQDGTNYDKDIMKSIKEFLIESIKIAKEAGIDDKKIILDPGIGFGKTFEQNIEVMSRLSELKELGYPILLGTSRKSMIGNILDVEPKDRVEGTIATTVLGIKDGVDIVRVHDVLENLRAIKVADAICRR
jgi:dihydropteroate synthase